MPAEKLSAPPKSAGISSSESDSTSGTLMLNALPVISDSAVVAWPRPMLVISRTTDSSINPKVKSLAIVPPCLPQRKVSVDFQGIHPGSQPISPLHSVDSTYAANLTRQFCGGLGKK